MIQADWELLFLGTGAADWPVDGPDCAASRSLSSAVLNRRILVDCTFATLRQIERFAVNPAGLTDVFLTHGHSDHYKPDALVRLAELRRNAGNRQPLRVHLDRQLADNLAIWLAAQAADRAVSGSESDPSGLLDICPLTVFAPVDAGPFVQVTPLPANHEGVVPGETPFSLLFSSPASCFLYATDGAWLPLPVWRFLQKQAGCRPLDAWVADCTIGDGHRGDFRIFEHNSLEMIRIMADTLFASQILKPEAPVILTHLARTLHPGQAELEQALQPPYLAAHDGLRLCFG